MSTPLKALIQERLRAKIVRQSDEDYEYEGGMYRHAGARAPPIATRSPYAHAEHQERSLPMSTPALPSDTSSGATASASSRAGFPLGLHTEIDPSAYIPHGHPLSARDYISRHTDALSPPPSYARHSHSHRHHQSHFPRFHREDDDGMFHHSSRVYHDESKGLELLSSTRWGEPSRKSMRVAATSPSSPTRGHFHNQSADELHSRRWHDKSSAAVPHRSIRRHYVNDSGDSDNNRSRGGGSPAREFRHERKRERRHEYVSEPHLTGAHEMREDVIGGDNQLWHGTAVPPSNFAFKSHLADREPAHSVRPAERTSYASSLAPSMDYMANKPRYGRHRQYQHRAQRQDEAGEDAAPDESVMLLPLPDTQTRSVDSQLLPSDLRPAPAPLDLSLTRSRTRTFDQILSPDSRLAANAFVEKRRRRSGKSTPRTMATQRWLHSLDLYQEP